MFVGGVPVAALAARKLTAVGIDIDLTSTAGGLACARNSVGTAIDASGVVQSFAANALRRTSAGLLVEVARTNSVLQSQALTPSPWGVNFATIVDNAAVAPNGTTTAASLTETTDNNAHAAFNAMSGGINGFASVFMKAGLRSIGVIQMNAGGNASAYYFTLTGSGSVAGPQNLAGSQTEVGGSGVITPLGNGWYRCSVTTVNSPGTIYIGSATANGTRTFAGSNTAPALYLWGAHIETATPGVLSSYIPTTTASVTRAADTITLPQAGIGRVVLTFDDASQQTISGIDTTQPYSLVPANLNRPLIRRLQGFAA